MNAGIEPRWQELGLGSIALETAPVAIYAVDLRGQVCFWNREAAALFGWSADEVMGRAVPFITDDGRRDATDAFRRIVAGQAVATGEFEPRNRNGDRFRMLATSTLVHDADGAPLAVLTLARDITADREAARILELAERKWRLLALRATEIITITDARGRILESTGEDQLTMGYPASWWREKSGFDIIHPDDLAEAATVWQRLVDRPGPRIRTVLRTRHREGHYELVEYTGINMLDDPVIHGIVLAGRRLPVDKQAELLLSDEARILEQIAREAPLDEVLDEIVRMVDYHTAGETGVFLLDPDPEADALRPLAVGTLAPEFVRLIERTPVSATARPHPDDDDSARFALDRPNTIVDFATDPRTARYAGPVLELGYRACWAMPIMDTRADLPLGFIGTYLKQARPPSRHERRVQERAGHLAGIAVERTSWQRELVRQARVDSLTELPNRVAIFDALEEALVQARLTRSKVTVMLIDLDRFKVINDSLGHAVGDRLITDFAHRLRTVLTGADFVGRVGADEFVVIFPPDTDDDQAYDTAVVIARALEAPFVIDQDDIFLTCSIGLASASLGLERADALLQQADMAMYRAKRQGRACTVVFDEGLRTDAVHRLEIDRDLRLAVERGEFVLHYQPEVDCTTGRIVGCEALLRWVHPERGLIAPDDFIGAAEETGVIVPIGYWVLDEAVRQARAWTELTGGEPFAVNVNLSARQLSNRGLVDTVAFVLTRHNWPPSALTLELTESIVIEDQAVTLGVLDRLRSLGVRLAIDDFGTGFASLDYLQRLHVDMIKIDRSFVTPLEADGTGSPVAAAMLHMAHAFDLTTCAEGVETAAQLAGLRALGCDLAQGFLMARPLPPEDFAALVQADRRW